MTPAQLTRRENFLVLPPVALDEVGPLRKVASPVLLPTVAGNPEALRFEYMLVLFNEICSFSLLDTTRYKCF